MNQALPALSSASYSRREQPPGGPTLECRGRHFEQTPGILVADLADHFLGPAQATQGVSGGLGAIGGDEGERRFLLGLRIGRACKDRSRDLYESMCE